MRIYKVIEQWPHREVACFFTLQDALIFMGMERNGLSLPIITSNELD